MLNFRIVFRLTLFMKIFFLLDLSVVKEFINGFRASQSIMPRIAQDEKDGCTGTGPE